MEIKVECPCGQHFKFDVEPSGGRMPVSINCPGCGVDATATANEVLTRSSGGTLLTPPPPTSAPSAPAAPASGGLRINKPSYGGTPIAGSALAAAPPPTATLTSTPARLPHHVPSYTPGYMRENDSIQNNNFYLGMLGAFIGACIGAGVMFAVALWLGIKLPFTGTLIGGLTGFLARVFYKGTDYTLGIAAAAIAFLVVGGTMFLLAGPFMFISIGWMISLIFATIFAWRVASG